MVGHESTNGQKLLRTWKNETVGVIEINRPEKANSYNHAVLVQLESILTHIENDTQIFTIIITGSGRRSFCAGADLNEMKEKSYRDAFGLKSAQVFSAIADFPKVTIAAINGTAVAGGLELALACDFRICTAEAKFSLPETKIGLIPAAGGTHRLPHIVGLGKAKELILGGCVWDASDALESGLVSEVCPENELMVRAQQWGKGLAKEIR